MGVGGERNDWERRYDESLKRDRCARANNDDVTGGEYAALEVSGCLPGWFGAIALTFTLLAAFLRRRRRP